MRIWRRLLVILLMTCASCEDPGEELTSSPRVTSAYRFDYTPNALQVEAGNARIGQEWPSPDRLSVKGYGLVDGTLFSVTDLESDGKRVWMVWVGDDVVYELSTNCGGVGQVLQVQLGNARLFILRTGDARVPGVDFVGIDESGLRWLGQVGDEPWQTRRAFVVELSENEITVYGMTPNNNSGLTPELRDYLSGMGLTVRLAE